MAKKIHYYNIFVTKKGEKSTYKLNHIFDKFIYPLDEQMKLKNCKTKPISLNNYLMPDLGIGGREGNFRTMAFADYRDDKPYLGEKGTNKREEIEDDVFEVTRSVIFPDDYLIAVEYNHAGCKAGHVAEYIRRFLPTDQDLDIEIIQIQQNDMLNKVLRSNSIKEIMVTIDASIAGVLDGLYDFKAKEEEKKSPIFTQIVEDSVDTAKEIGASKAVFGFGQGRKKNVIKQKEIISFINLLDINNPSLINLTVTFIDPDTHEKIVKNLKTESFIEDEICEGSFTPGDENVRDEIIDSYNKRGASVKNKYKDFPSLININIEG
ncbi:hypothetical protein JI641_14420 [Listeria ivanovii subsp. londoniensis]|uniref:hypothetical protein n=1 Tax=Listeria ivanovii TaxID=1638 RepID=UPI0019058234|nr:hypothetical protein [Listeria ivanovii]MBK2004175.1 hypothetical protein [Listeria ivanovii subsp. londoniensis]